MAKVNWDVLSSDEFRGATTCFALNLLSGRDLVRKAKSFGLPKNKNIFLTEARHLLDTYGAEKAREIARKALRRRRILNHRNVYQVRSR